MMAITGLMMDQTGILLAFCKTLCINKMAFQMSARAKWVTLSRY